MYNNPLNLGLRFMLELAALYALGYWGFHTGDGISAWLLGIGVPLIAAAFWGTFRVPNDPGPAPVTVPGGLRLSLEAIVFVSAVILLSAAQRPEMAAVLAGLLIFHYLISYDRVIWLLKQ